MALPWLNDTPLPPVYHGRRMAMPPAHEAARDGRVEDLRVLVQDQGDEVLTMTDDMGWVPAHAAARNGHTDVLTFIAETSCHGFTARNIHGSTPAHLAARGGHEEILRLLTVHEGRAVLTALDNEGWLPAHSAARGGHVECLSFIAETLGSLPIDTQPKLEDIAYRYKQTEVLSFLKTYGLDEMVARITKQVAEMDAKAHIKSRKARISRFLVDPRTSKWIGWWDLVLSFALLFTATFTPFEVGFTGIPVDRWTDPLFLINRVVDCLVSPPSLERSRSAPRSAASYPPERSCVACDGTVPR